MISSPGKFAMRGAVLLIAVGLLVSFFNTLQTLRANGTSTVDFDDPAIVAATAEAQLRLRELRDFIDKGEEGYGYTVASTIGPENNQETFWITVDGYHDDVFTGFAQVDSAATSIKAGDQAEVQADEVNDWSVFHGQDLVAGSFVEKAIADHDYVQHDIDLKSVNQYLSLAGILCIIGGLVELASLQRAWNNPDFIHQFIATSSSAAYLRRHFTPEEVARLMEFRVIPLTLILGGALFLMGVYIQLVLNGVISV